MEKLLLTFFLVMCLTITVWSMPEKREVPKDVSDCIEGLEPLLKKYRAIYIQCQLSTGSDPEASDSSDNEPDEEAAEKCFIEANAIEPEGMEQMEKCENLMSQLPPEQQGEALHLIHDLTDI